MIKNYLIVLLTFVAIDGLWLGLIAKKLYAEALGHLMTQNVNWVSAILFYLLFIGGLLYFVITPGLAQGQWQRVLLSGVLFGLVTYGTYDLTNLATLKDWPIRVTVIDLIWGAFLSGSVSLISFWLIRRLP